MLKTTLDNYFSSPATIVEKDKIEVNGTLLGPTALTKLAGCPKGGQISILTTLKAVHLNSVCDGFIRSTNEVQIRRDAEGFYLYPDYIWYDDSAPVGFGAIAFLKMAEEAASLGFTRVELLAGGGSGIKLEGGAWSENYVGYYAWARFGFDAKLWPVTLNLIKDVPELADCTTVSEIMERDPQWWKDNGDGCDMVFDLGQDSKSWQILLKYLHERTLLT